MLDWMLPLVILPPFFAATVNGLLALLGKERCHVLAQRLTCTTIILSFLGSVLVLFSGDPSVPHTIHWFDWLHSGEYFVPISFYLDSLSVTMMLLTTFLSSLVSVFSVNYMHNEENFLRFFATLPFFVGMMLVLVLANNYVLLFAGWEGVGLASYLLITYYQDRPMAAKAGTRAILTNRVGDIALLAVIFLCFAEFKTVEFSGLLPSSHTSGWICLCLCVAAAVKSAQFPFTPWLNRAMEGPTPSSALFYGGVMVTAGVYLLLRSTPFFHGVPLARTLLMVFGSLTVAYSGFTALVQSDIKGILSLSSSMHLGLLFLFCGLQAYPLALVYMVTFTLFNIFRFLSAPSMLLEYQGITASAKRLTGLALPRSSEIYSMALHRFYLEEWIAKWIVRPTWACAKALAVFDIRFSNTMFGSPFETESKNLPEVSGQVHKITDTVSIVVQTWEKILLRLSSFGLPKVAEWLSLIVQKLEKNVLFGITESMIPKNTRFLGRIFQLFDSVTNKGINSLSMKKVNHAAARRIYVIGGVFLTIFFILGFLFLAETQL